MDLSSESLDYFMAKTTSSQFSPLKFQSYRMSKVSAYMCQLSKVESNTTIVNDFYLPSHQEYQIFLKWCFWRLSDKNWRFESSEFQEKVEYLL